MNPNETEELMHTIHSVRDQFGVAILLIEHDYELCHGICEEITVLDYGRVIARGDGKAIRNNPRSLRHIWEVTDDGRDAFCQKYQCLLWLDPRHQGRFVPCQ